MTPTIGAVARGARVCVCGGRVVGGGPTAKSLMVGASIALLGELLRTWAAGHLEKSKEVTSSGPYRYMRHPLYLGSTLIGIGLALAANNPFVVFVLVIGYLAATLTAAMRSEEAHLREKFGGAYDAYAETARRRWFADSAGHARSAIENITPWPGSQLDLFYLH